METHFIILAWKIPWTEEHSPWGGPLGRMRPAAAGFRPSRSWPTQGDDKTSNGVDGLLEWAL